MEILEAIVSLSHEFGSSSFVRGGGGNTSCKDCETLWVKPSGTTLSGLERDSFVQMDRARLRELFAFETPASAHEREELVKNMMAEAVKPGSFGRPSVEAPLHESFDHVFVVHTHPALVNGMTCSVRAEESCRELFPEALWIPYTDPGYTLCIRVRRMMEDYAKTNGRQPDMVFLQNHGVFIAGNEPEEIHSRYRHVMGTLKKAYEKAGVQAELKIGPTPTHEEVDEFMRKIREAMRDEFEVHITVSGVYELANGPLTPDHIVYTKSFQFVGEPDVENIQAFKAEHGYLPQVVNTGKGIFGVAGTDRAAKLALELSQDGALVSKLAEAFGGVSWMTDASREFIENWEVEAYRAKVATS